jgi:hypothetical protein
MHPPQRIRCSIKCDLLRVPVILDAPRTGRARTGGGHYELSHLGDDNVRFIALEIGPGRVTGTLLEPNIHCTSTEPPCVMNLGNSAALKARIGTPRMKGYCLPGRLATIGGFLVCNSGQTRVGKAGEPFNLLMEKLVMTFCEK